MSEALPLGTLQIPARLAEPIRRALSGELSANMALMQLVIAADDPAEIDGALQQSVGGMAPEAAARLEEVLGLWRSQPDIWRRVKATIAEAEHDGPAGRGEGGIAHWAGVFDRVAALSPEAGVALYSLGDPALLAAATAEIVERLSQWGLVGPGKVVLDVGCGIGRVAAALSPSVESVIGLDISSRMIAEARRRCADLANVRFDVSSGRDLGSVADTSVDLVLAADVFPYLVSSGLASTHLHESRRVLRAGGQVVILNYSYKGDLVEQRADLGRDAAEAGFDLVRNGTREFRLWDGVAFQLRAR